LLPQEPDRGLLPGRHRAEGRKVPQAVRGPIEKVGSDDRKADRGFFQLNRISLHHEVRPSLPKMWRDRHRALRERPIRRWSALRRARRADMFTIFSQFEAFVCQNGGYAEFYRTVR